MAFQQDAKLFNRWSFDDVEVSDISLADYIADSSEACYISSTYGRKILCRKRLFICSPMQNPIQVIVDAIINSGPREDATRIGSAGVVRRQAVDISPLRRVNQAIYLLTTGAPESAFRNIKTIAECLADELINAAKGSSNSYAIKKKDEIERVAKANR
ncbi:hypothetical protein OPV22_028868 [Ensete ventricosum]|uniref:Small ribosomal subunit protein uS7 domain-containing protein n=1 Tax=Ensete ventricosum TaxID=4639 RepID=A0AAV8Q1J8_ENSVE|nr:hypothetical protein OPV22_028868 [Ensete ventricosum]